jgi:hypothetical protein
MRYERRTPDVKCHFYLEEAVWLLQGAIAILRNHTANVSRWIVQEFAQELDTIYGEILNLISHTQRLQRFPIA